MAVGNVYVNPEEGWKRFDDKHELIHYVGGWSDRSAGGYQGSYKWAKEQTDTINFKFKGSGIRIIGPANIDLQSNMKINIDGKEYHYSLYNKSLVWNMCVFELEVNKGVHKVKISIDGTMDRIALLDAIDIKDGDIVNTTVKVLILKNDILYTIKDGELLPLGVSGVIDKNDAFIQGIESISKEELEKIRSLLKNAKLLKKEMEA